MKTQDNPKNSKFPGKGKDKELNPNFEGLEPPNITDEAMKEHLAGLAQEMEAADLHTILENARVLPTEEIPEPETAWEQNLGPGINIPLGTLGNISLIIGKAKSRKSFLVNIAAAVLVGERHPFKMLTGRLPSDQDTVLYFDTEQSKYHVQKALKRICTNIGIETPPNLQVYALRKYSPNERDAIVKHAINTIPGIGFVVIDGIKDLITSINDEEQAANITSKLMKWSEEKNIHILTVLHQNKGDNNARGHIGTELINKSETVLSVTKSNENKDISIVEAEFCRNQEPEPFAFQIINGLPELIPDYELRTAKPSKIDLLELSETAQYGILNQVFSVKKNFGYEDLRLQVQIAFEEKHGVKPGVNKTKDFIKYCRDNRKWIYQEKNRGPYFKGDFSPIGLSE